jgi:hypothetical protein
LFRKNNIIIILNIKGDELLFIWSYPWIYVVIVQVKTLKEFKDLVYLFLRRTGIIGSVIITRIYYYLNPAVDRRKIGSLKWKRKANRNAGPLRKFFAILIG